MMLELLDLIKEFCRGRIGVALLGLIAICSLIWFGTALLGLQDVYRFCLMLGVIGIYLVVLITRWWLTHARGAALHKKLQEQGEQIAGRQLEIELLKEKMDEAITALKSSELGVRYRGSAALYALPWFIVIGSSASGKSTLLRNSGLHFPFASREDLNVKGFGGTRNCDWWFADEAILLDTAGRYTTEEDDHEEWRAFLELLKKYRPRLPINGIIVALSLVDLLTANNEGVTWHVKVIRERIEELYAKLGYVFPVYLIFTKGDLLKGFNAFFTDLSEAERNQVWGLNLSGEDDYEKCMNAFAAKLQQLYLRLCQWRLQKIAVTRNLHHKIDIYDFPEQFNASIPKIMELVRLLFKTNPYQETPHFCGAYFTSGTQEGAPIQRLVDNTHAMFGYMEKTGRGNLAGEPHLKSYFIKDMFSRVIFSNQNAVAKTSYRLHLQRWCKSASVVTALILIIITFMLYSASLTANTLLLWRGERIAQGLADNANNSANPAALAALLDTGDYYQTLLDYQQQTPWYLRLGLYRGGTQIPSFQTMLLAVMRTAFLQPVGSATEQQLQVYAKQWSTTAQTETLRGPYYLLLRAYLMLSFPARLQIDQAVAPLSSLWAHIMTPDNNIDPEDLAQYNKLVRFYLVQLQEKNTQVDADMSISPSAWHPNVELIAHIRQQLYLPPSAENIYAQLRSTGAMTLPPVILSDLVQGKGANLLTSQQVLPGIYTAKAWHEYVQPTIEQAVRTANQGDWVIDVPLTELDDISLPVKNSETDAAAAKRMTATIRKFYFNDYLSAWRQFLSAVQIIPFGSIQDGLAELNILNDKKGPIMQLLSVFAENIDIKEGSLSYVVELDKPLASLRKIISPEGKMSETIQAYFVALAQIPADLQKLAASSDQEREAQTYAAKILAGSGNDLEIYKSALAVNMFLNAVDNGPAKEAVKAILLQPIRESWRAIITAGTHGLEQQWQTQVYNYYQQNLAERFPFNKNASADVALSNMNDFLQPKTGVLWAFINNYLSAYLYADTQGWHEQQWLNVGAGFSPQFLQALSQLKALSDGLFGGGSQTDFSFQIYPEPTPGLSQIILTANGQTFHYQNGPQQWQNFNWPGVNPQAGSELTAIAANGMSPDTLSAPGPWGLFRLLAQSQITPVQAAIYRATWQFKSDKRTYAVTLLFQADSNNNLFQQLLLRTFNLPVTLFSG